VNGSGKKGDFLKCSRARERSLGAEAIHFPNGQGALEALALIRAAIESARTGAPVPLEK